MECGIAVRRVQGEEQGKYRQRKGGGEIKTELLLDFNQRLLFANGYSLQLPSPLRSTGSVQLQLGPGRPPYRSHTGGVRVIQIHPTRTLNPCLTSNKRLLPQVNLMSSVFTEHSATVVIDTLLQNQTISYIYNTLVTNTDKLEYL